MCSVHEFSRRRARWFTRQMMLGPCAALKIAPCHPNLEEENKASVQFSSVVIFEFQSFQTSKCHLDLQLHKIKSLLWKGLMYQSCIPRALVLRERGQILAQILRVVAKKSVLSGTETIKTNLLCMTVNLSPLKYIHSLMTAGLGISEVWKMFSMSPKA